MKLDIGTRVKVKNQVTGTVVAICQKDDGFYKKYYLLLLDHEYRADCFSGDCVDDTWLERESKNVIKGSVNVKKGNWYMWLLETKLEKLPELYKILNNNLMPTE